MKALLGNLAVMGVSLVFMLVIGEVLVRVAMPQQLIQIRPDIWQPADTLGWTLRPDVRTTINTGEGTVPVRTDARGMRVGERGRIEAPRCLLLIGDSYMEAFQVSYEQSLAGRLEAALPARVGGPVAVRNVAAGAWDPNHYLLATRMMLPREHCPLVLVTLYVGNDLVDRRVAAYPPRQPLERHPLRLPRDGSRREWINALLLPVNDFLETRSQLYILVRSRLWGLRVRMGLAPTTGIPFQFLKREAGSPSWGMTADLCRDLDVFVRAHRARALFVLIPTAYQTDHATFERWRMASRLDSTEVDLDLPGRRLTEELRARGVEVVDALPWFRKVAARGGEPLFGAVDTHLSPAGHAALADLVLPRVAEGLGRAGR